MDRTVFVLQWRTSGCFYLWSVVGLIVVTIHSGHSGTRCVCIVLSFLVGQVAERGWFTFRREQQSSLKSIERRLGDPRP